MNNLDRLRRLAIPRNTAAWGGRMPEPGMEEFKPSDASLKILQDRLRIGSPSRTIRTGDEPWSLGGGGSAVSGTSNVGGSYSTLPREELRGMVVESLKQRLGLQRRKHEEDLELGAQKGRFEIDKARQEAEAYADQVKLQENSWMRKDAARQGALDERTQYVQGQVSERAGNRQTTAGTPTDAMEKRLAESREGPGLLARFIPGRQAASREAHERNLVSVLTRMGSLRGLQADLGILQDTPGGSLDERITNAGGDPGDLHPYEREWLELQLGR